MFKLLKKIFRRKQKGIVIKNIKYRQLDEQIRVNMVDGLGSENYEELPERGGTCAWDLWEEYNDYH